MKQPYGDTVMPVHKVAIGDASNPKIPDQKFAVLVFHGRDGEGREVTTMPLVTDEVTTLDLIERLQATAKRLWGN
jgi:hypothetical protein